MSKILDATCVAGLVTASLFPVAEATILSEGVGPSLGLLIMDEDKATYVTSNASDLKSTLEKIASALGDIVTALTAIDAKPTGGTGSAPVPVAAASIIQLTTIQGELTALKEILK